MSFFKSLRSKSHKAQEMPGELGAKQAQTPAETNGAHSATLPDTTSSVISQRPASLKGSKSRLFGSHGSQSRRKNSSSDHVSRAANFRAASSAATYPSILPKLSDEQGTVDVNPAQDSASPDLSSQDLAPPPGSRPSDLFAGKGIEWGKLDLATGNTAGQSAAKSDELQSFLKARRQWVPTFITEPKDESDVRSVTSPDDIAFSDVPQTGSLLSIKDLDESHQRKQKLMGNLGTSDWSQAAAGLPTSSPSAGPSATSAAEQRSLSNPPVSAAITGAPPVAPSSEAALTQMSANKSNSISRKPVQKAETVAAQSGQVAAPLEQPPRLDETNGVKPPLDALANEEAIAAPQHEALTDQAPANEMQPSSHAAQDAPSTPAPVTAATTTIQDAISSTAGSAVGAGGSMDVEASIDNSDAFVTPSDSAAQPEAGHGITQAASGEVLQASQSATLPTNLPPSFEAQAEAAPAAAPSLTTAALDAVPEYPTATSS